MSPVYSKMPKSLKLYKWEKRVSFFKESYYINKYTNKLSDGGIFKETIEGSEIRNGEFDTNYGTYYIDEDGSYCYYANMIKDYSEVKEKGPEESIQGYVYSTNPLTYPPDGDGGDGYWYTFIQNYNNNETLYFWKEYEAQSACVIHHTNYFSPPEGYPYFMETIPGGSGNDYGHGNNTIAWNKEREVDTPDSHTTDAYYIIQKATYNIKLSFPQTTTVPITTCDTRLYEPIQEIPIVNDGEPNPSYTFSNVQPYMWTSSAASSETDEESVENGTSVSLPFYNPTYYYCSLENSGEWKNEDDTLLYSAQIDQTKFNYVYSTSSSAHNTSSISAPQWESIVSNPDTKDPRNYKLYIPVDI